ncbi:MAG: hypothetical protein BJ554DRAFT_7459 [Olpidium bornovanus]|uniref:EIPR1-like beta-propeller domain-containing protein n=1 Tax=Olpidium bornovanus TaxID=278681 RepID=A0A8H7ZWW7_9FUNG|nr:MAG: hypothetical protein BJ554DRAFT_7459 [Olpidium bornovanus]
MEAADRSCVYGLRHLVLPLRRGRETGGGGGDAREGERAGLSRSSRHCRVTVFFLTASPFFFFFFFPRGSKARSLTAILGDKGRNRFLVGTQDVRKDHNEVHVIEFDEDRSEITSQVYRHAHEILTLAACPVRPELFFSINVAEGNSQISVVRLFSVLWDPTGGLAEVVTVDDAKIQTWSLGDSLSSAKVSESGPNLMLREPTKAIAIVGEPGAKITTARWSPHSPQVVVAAEAGVRGWDLRSSRYQPERRALRAAELCISTTIVRMRGLIPVCLGVSR